MSEFRVLIPLDGSRYAEHALAYLPVLARLGEVHLQLLSVVDTPGKRTGEALSEAEARDLNVLQTYLHEVAADVDRHLKISTTVDALGGNPADVIVEKAREHQADVLIISTHGRSGLTRWRRGSVADKVIRTAPVPVLAVGPRAMEQGQWLEAGVTPPFQRLLVPLDGSDLAELAVPQAARYAAAFGSQINLLQVVPIPITGDAFAVPAHTAPILDDLVSSGREYLAQVRDRYGLPQETVTDAEVGTPSVSLEDYVQEQSIDLVVMTSRGRGGFGRAILGSVTDRLIGAGPPVLIVKPPQ